MSISAPIGAQLSIHTHHIRHNLLYFRSFLKPQTKLMALVKANAYGHGAPELSLFLEREHLADYLGVAFPSEALELRKAGVSLPILVLTPGMASFSELIDAETYPEIGSPEALAVFAEAARGKATQPVPFHLALDTGMHRVGFAPEQLPQLLSSLQAYSHIQPLSVFSHLAAADETQHDAFTLGQIALFEQMTTQICAALPQRPLLHLLNSPGTERFPQAQFDMVRVGIGMYGTSAVDQSKLKHPSSLLCPIIQIKEVPTGETVGYGRHGKVPQNSKTIATLPIGYADGVDRHLGRGVGKFMVNGHLAPTIGNICMDMCMIDVTGIPAAPGNTVTLFGAAPTALDWAAELGTISYEIYTSIAPRVKRVFVDAQP